ncbi:MAG TPA: TIGR03118 family protein [Bryobacteraceae bacterium]|nr:TIGR03118 family protein [Bryobacteraceae bacterium]
MKRPSVIYAIAALVPVIACAQSNNVYVQENLVSDIPGMAVTTDPNLVNPWGMSQTATSPFWVSNHDKGNTTIYNGAGTPSTTVVTIPPAAGTGTGTPTGQITGNGANWTLPAPNGKAASFIFATEDGAIAAWNGSAGTTAVIVVNNSNAGAIYTGIASNPSGTPAIYAANFGSGNIDVFDENFNPTTASGGFKDPNLPSGYAPYNIWNLSGKLYVAYAQPSTTSKGNSVAGAGLGYVDVFDTNGNLLQRVVSGGALNAPWGVAIAPANWGAFGGALLVGNFGDGKINAFNVSTGAMLGTLQNASGNPIVNQGLWAIEFGNGKTADTNTLYLAANISPGGVSHGLFAAIAPPSQVTGILNAASLSGTAVAPGEIVVLNGFTIGPIPLVSATIPSTGSLGTSIASGGGTSVTFNGTAAPILYASASATSVIVPYEVAGSTTASVVVTYKGAAAAAFSVNVAATAPGLFTLNESGSGELVAVNSDGSLNGTANPAARGTPVLLYATGEGQTDPPGTDGAVTGEFVRIPTAAVSLMIGGQPATVVYAGSAPGDVAGVMEIEAIIPANASTGAAPVVLTVGSANSPSGTTISLK